MRTWFFFVSLSPSSLRAGFDFTSPLTQYLVSCPFLKEEFIFFPIDEKRKKKICLIGQEPACLSLGMLSSPKARPSLRSDHTPNDATTRPIRWVWICSVIVLFKRTIKHTNLKRTQNRSWRRVQAWPIRAKRRPKRSVGKANDRIVKRVPVLRTWFFLFLSALHRYARASILLRRWLNVCLSGIVSCVSPIDQAKKIKR